ncbi:hypothetical protein ACFZBU_39625 [Embleya sp. NPDC008237]|uniref:hypothetical protein n=1 Tax=Embleya sp. NPDC008237 TaxID=3363978 RepID=UPI0036E93C93
MNPPSTQPSSGSYASRTRRAEYVQAMKALAADRRPDTPVRVYVSVPPTVMARETWPTRLEAIRTALPAGVELLYYATAFPADADWDQAWPAFSPTLDGLVLIGKRTKPGSMSPTLQLGPVARKELRTIVARRRPVLLHTYEFGLVPIVDCRPHRRGSEGRERLKLRVPDGWDSDSATLQAALEALRPVESERSGE